MYWSTKETVHLNSLFRPYTSLGIFLVVSCRDASNICASAVWPSVTSSSLMWINAAGLRAAMARIVRGVPGSLLARRLPGRSKLVLLGDCQKQGGRRANARETAGGRRCQQIRPRAKAVFIFGTSPGASHGCVLLFVLTLCRGAAIQLASYDLAMTQRAI